jgi:hypothetical protein
MRYPKKRFILPVLAALTMALWPGQVNSIEATNNAGVSMMPMLSEYSSGVSPLAKPRQNNWGAPKDEKVEVTLFNSNNAIGWSWSRLKPVRRPGVAYLQPIYPNAGIYLKSPTAVSDIQSFYLFTDFHYTMKPTGDYNLSYDIFLREKGTKAHKVEIMVWFDWKNNQPARYFEGVCTDGNNNYSKYWWTTVDGCLYRSFLLKTQPNKIPGPVDLKALIDLIQPEKDWYIDEVSLGTEVWSGSGALELTTYYLELNGVRL